MQVRADCSLVPSPAKSRHGSPQRQQLIPAEATGASLDIRVSSIRVHSIWIWDRPADHSITQSAFVPCCCNNDCKINLTISLSLEACLVDTFGICGSMPNKKAASQQPSSITLLHCQAVIRQMERSWQCKRPATCSCNRLKTRAESMPLRLRRPR